jgi:hypothetical protein
VHQSFIPKIFFADFITTSTTFVVNRLFIRTFDSGGISGGSGRYSGESGGNDEKVTKK